MGAPNIIRVFAGFQIINALPHRWRPCIRRKRFHRRPWSHGDCPRPWMQMGNRWRL